jgi:hypothetical protein
LVLALTLAHLWVHLWVDRAGGARHSPGMAQKSIDEAWRPPGTEESVNRMLYESQQTIY